MELAKLNLTATPSKVSINFDEIKSSLESYVSEYDVIVTSDTVGDAKKAATKLNKLSAEIKDSIKSRIDELSQPINDLKDKSKQLQQICQDGRSKLTEQVAKFEEETKEKCHEKLCKLRSELWDSYEINIAYRSAAVDDMVKLTALTGKGELTKATIEQLEARVVKDLSVQQKVEKRHAELESRCLRAGLVSPLTPNHVAAFIFDDDYDEKVEGLIQNELERQKAIEDAAAKKAEQQRQDEIKAEQDRQAEQQQEEVVEPDVTTVSDTPKDPDPVNTSSGIASKVVKLQIVLECKVPATVPDDAVARKITNDLKASGFEAASVCLI